MSALEAAALDTTSSPEKTRPRPSVRTAIGILVSRFPRLEETYLLREINELERQGQPVVLIPLLLEDGKVIHEEAEPWLRRALYFPLFSAAIARANVARLLRHPLQYIRLLLRLILGTLVRPGTLIRTLALFPKSVYLAAVLPRLGLSHIHAHFATHATTMAYIIASLSDVTFSFTVHGPDVFVHRLLLADKLARARFVRTASTFNKAFLTGLFPALARDKIEVVHMGLNPDVYERASAEASQKARLQLLSVATLVPNKGFPYLIDACAQMIRDGVDVDCTIVGRGSLYDTTAEWITHHGLSERVHLLGALPQHEVAKLMGECDVFVLPSVIALDGQMDGIPTSLMEAMAAGRPIVASSLSGIPELVEHNVSGLLVDATHPDRVAAALRRLAEDPALRERMGSAGQKKVRREFDVRVTAASFIQLLDQHQQPRTATAKRVALLDWDQLEVCAIGVRHIVERKDSIVVGVAVTDGIANRDVIVKLHGDLDRARYEYDVLRTLGRSMTATTSADNTPIIYTVPSALMIDEPAAAVVTGRAPGETLENMLRRNGTASVTTPLRHAGTWLRMMQEQTRGDEDGRYVLTATVLLALRDLDLAAAADPGLRRHHDAVTERLRTLESQVADRPLPVVGHHGDFSPANVFISERRVTAVNADDFREGLPLGDVASFLLRLESMFPHRGAHRGDAAAAFLAGYSDAPIDRLSLTLLRMTKALQWLARSGDGVTPSGAARRMLIGEITRGLS
ncbi:MAG: glycosyltransferase family 4 protein [Acidobacteriota bacterium]|nr:glycosyltransferase family 4 protein [Acidobacteriota bacterium]